MEQHGLQDQEATSTSAIRVQFPTDADAYEIIGEIGVSDHSIVYLAICKSVDSTTVAVKVMDIDVDLDQTSIKNMKSLSLINHANILRPHCCFTADDGRLWIVMPFIQSGPLQAIMSNPLGSGLPDQFIAILINQLLHGVVCLHKLGYFHKAIKGSNIFFDSQGSVLLSDLSILKTTNDRNDDNKSSISVPYWTPPDNKYSFKSDVWSIGILAMEIAYGGPPITNSRILNLEMGNILRRFPYESNLDNLWGKSFTEQKLKFDVSFKNFVTSCLVKDKFKRPCASSLLAHPFIKNGERSNIWFKSIFKGTVGIRNRFEEVKDRITSLMKKEMKVEKDSQSKKIIKISGWDYNDFIFELEPDEKSLEKITFRFSKSEERKFDMQSLLQRMDSLNGQKSEDKKVQVMDSENVWKLLSTWSENIDQQRETIAMLETGFAYLLENELEMTNDIKRSEVELAIEEERRVQLELDYADLKLKIPDSEEEEDSPDNN